MVSYILTPAAEYSITYHFPDPQHTYDATAAAEIDPLGQQVKEVIATINRLEGLGLQRLKIPLPKCIVLGTSRVTVSSCSVLISAPGEQSTGKSSVIEGISGIKTPRADDTCTRCPLFIKLEPSENSRANWSASVSLRRDYGYYGNKSGGSEHRFPGWVELRQPNVVHFADTENPHELEEIIARAQLAIINPMMDFTDFLRSTVAALQEKPHCDFSPNIVCISISHPTLPSLSFYDLPGIINQAETQDKEFLVDFVRNLVTDYVKDEESLILVTCSLDTDIANSSAGGIARRLNATDRCIGKHSRFS